MLVMVCAARGAASSQLGTEHVFSLAGTEGSGVRGSMFVPRWSPTGREIAWTELRGRDPRIWVASADGSGAHPVTPPIDALGEMRWLPAGEIIYWANFRLFRIRPGGRTSFVSAVSGGSFVIDARGTRIATGQPECPRCAGPITVMPISGGQSTKIGGNHVMNTDPTFAPGGRRIAFQRTFCKEQEQGGDCHRPAGIWTSSTSGGPLKQITRSGFSPMWSPDGRRILYIDDGARVVAPRGGPSTLMFRNVAVNSLTLPSWSADSSSFAVVGDNGRLVVVDATTRRAKQVTGRAIGEVIGFSWSPDSQSLLVTGRPSPRACSSLWAVNSDTGAARLLRQC
jgi:Tol biopolymer transport system component